VAKLRVGVLISGRGSNLQALIEAAADPAYPAEVVLVISNRAEAQGLQRAAEAGIAHEVIAEPDRTAFAAAAGVPHSSDLWLVARAMLDSAGGLFGLYLAVMIGLLLIGRVRAPPLRHLRLEW